MSTFCRRKRPLENTNQLQFVVIGGGIAAVSCVRELCGLIGSNISLTLISASSVLKEAKVTNKITNYIEELVVVETDLLSLVESFPKIKVILGVAESIDTTAKVITLADQRTFHFDKLCICTGCSPTLIASNPDVVGIRDSESLSELTNRLSSARTVTVIGNGGISLELLQKIDFCSIEWIVRDNHIGSAFFDSVASEFLLPTLSCRMEHSEGGNIRQSDAADRLCESPDVKIEKKNTVIHGGALGPGWAAKSDFSTKMSFRVNRDIPPCPIRVHFNESVVAVRNKLQECEKFPLYIQTSSGKNIGCDFVISATGVNAINNLAFVPSEMKRDMTNDVGALAVNKYMETSVSDIYAAGDCCSINSIDSVQSHWFQMRLWTQARQLGSYAARCMCDRNVGEPDMYNFFFELFAHVTQFLGHKVILLGRFNGQGLSAELTGTMNEYLKTAMSNIASEENDYIFLKNGIRWDCEKNCSAHAEVESKRSANDIDVWIRIKHGVEYVKLLLHQGLVVGAVLIGDTDLEETIENLILNQTDVSCYDINILQPDFEIDDYFD